MATPLEDQLNSATRETLGGLTSEERAGLSKALFPETHTQEITLLGKPRVLRPLTIKYAKMLHAQLQPLAKELAGAMQGGAIEVVDDQVISHVMKAAGTIAEFYSWDDVIGAINDEDIDITQLQTLVVQQARLNGENDFLLGPLRVVILVMQMHELITVRLRSMSDMLPSLDSGIAASPNS
jgi:hypothetical protein